MNQNQDKNKNFFIAVFTSIKKWSIEKKRIFSLIVAVVLTILIIVLTSAINLLWKEEVPKKIYDKNSPTNTIKDSFSEIFDQIQSVTALISSSTSQAQNQINSAPSSLSTSSSTQTPDATSSSSTKSN